MFAEKGLVSFLDGNQVCAFVSAIFFLNDIEQVVYFWKTF